MVQSPHKDYFKIASDWNKVYRAIFYMSLILSVIVTFWENETINETFITIMSLTLLIIIEQIIKYYTFKAEEIRRKDHLDNSLGSKYLHSHSQNYYDTNEINTGLYKMIVNTFESALFSYTISEKMRNKKVLKNLLLFICIIALSIIGFTKSKYGLTILQLFLSKDYILDFVDIYIYNSRVKNIFDDLKKLFDNNLKNNSRSINKNMSEIIRLYMEYETNISDSKIALDSSIYNQVNESLTQEWEQIKIEYKIE